MGTKKANLKNCLSGSVVTGSVCVCVCGNVSVNSSGSKDIMLSLPMGNFNYSWLFPVSQPNSFENNAVFPLNMTNEKLH